MSEFANKPMLMTGADRGSGRETALAFGANGAKAGVNYAHSASKAEQLSITALK